MSRATPEIQAFAKGLVDYEARESDAPEVIMRAAFYICERLAPHLSGLMGKEGFSALLARALALAMREVPEMDAVLIQSDSSLVVQDVYEDEGVPEKLAKGSVVLVAELIGLLEAFIGESLTLRLVRSAWPKMSGGKSL